MKSWTLFCFFAHGLCLLAQAQAADARPQPKPVPKMQAIPLPHHQISFQRDGRELTRMHYGPDQERPFLFPILGPSGRSLTRMGHPRDPESHSHHNSVWISHHDVAGVDFWGDRGQEMGRIVHRRLERFEDTPSEAWVETLGEWVSPSRGLLVEHRRVTVQDLPEDEWLLLIDVRLEPKSEPVLLGKTPFGLIGVRLAKTIGVHDGGGVIRNSEGGVNEKEIFWKPARWVDYSGPIAPGVTEGVALLDHPANPNHPTVFHVRDDGWMGASLTFDGPRTIGKDQPLTLRYGLYVHKGHAAAERIESVWQQFSRSAPP